MTDADELLFSDKNGHPADLGDVISDGLDGGYEDRIPGLIELLTTGTPEQRLFATVALLSWGEPAGYEQLSSWSRDPRSVPWADAPVVTTRMSGADGAWEMLADGLQNSTWLDSTAELRSRRAQGAADLLRLADHVDYDRTLSMAIAGDDDMLADSEPDLRAAIERSLGRFAAGDRPGFDLATQTVGLVGALARRNDQAAAEYARRLTEVAPNRRMLCELTYAMANGTGPATIERLRELLAYDDPDVHSDAERALDFRTQQ